MSQLQASGRTLLSKVESAGPQLSAVFNYHAYSHQMWVRIVGVRLIQCYWKNGTARIFRDNGSGCDNFGFQVASRTIMATHSKFVLRKIRHRHIGHEWIPGIDIFHLQDLSGSYCLGFADVRDN